MKAFDCDDCGSLLFFESVQCVRCGHALGFLPDTNDLSTLEPAENGTWRAMSPAVRGRLYRACSNGEQHQICNWLIPIDDPDPFCVSCRLNDVIPDLDVPGNLARWAKLEAAKRRVVYTLIRLGLSTDGVPSENRPPLRFCFLGAQAEGPPPVTGHSAGTITVNIAEADDDERERRRVYLHESYRTLLGHLRHEVAHYYWDQLIAGTPALLRFRELFGDEQWDYEAALQRYYHHGPAPDWQTHHVTAYASAHPWEDWAETWAHYMHIIDTMETAANFGLRASPRHPDASTMRSDPGMVAVDSSSFDNVLAQWLPLTCVLNSLNRGMGLQDLYPFVLPTRAIEKLKFVHEIVRTLKP